MNALTLRHAHSAPAILANAGENAATKFLEFFAARKLYRRRHRVETSSKNLNIAGESPLGMTNSARLSWALFASPSCSPFASHRRFTNTP
jgi:hypothetical protein